MDDADVVTAHRGREHEVRIGVESADPHASPGCDLADVLDGSLAAWHVEPLLVDDREVWLVSGYVEPQVGTTEYARLAHTLVQEILATGAVKHAEADVPVTAFVRRGVSESGAPGSPPGSESPRWARDAIRCDDAWAIEPTRGAGILIGHPDTGYTLHPGLGSDAFDLQKDRDFIGDDDDARDPLIPPALSPWPLTFPGHGTTTASVMVGRGSEGTGILGVAPGSTVVPLRAVESVIQIFDSDVARAVEHARLSGCHVVSISVGGKGFRGLKAAIQKAVDAGLIVIAAAGNNVPFVVAPASYPNCLAVAATGPDDSPWPETSRGPEVDVSAPGWGVHVAGYVWEGDTPDARILRSSGSSYAATHLAGVAALWLAHHGPELLRERYGSHVQAVFLHQLKTGGSRVPDGWVTGDLGAGIVDAAAMLAAPLPVRDEQVADAAFQSAESPLARLSVFAGVDESGLEAALADRTGRSGSELYDLVARFEGELAFHLIENPEFGAALVGSAARERTTHDSLAGSSPQFRSVFAGVDDIIDAGEEDQPRLSRA